MSPAPGPPDDDAPRAAQALLDAGGERPEVAILLGSGLAPAADGIDIGGEVPYDAIPGFPTPTVPGHPGRAIVGRLEGVPILAFLGRFHFYEGHPMRAVTLPPRVAAAAGARTFVATAAVGGLEPGATPGSLVVVRDHINLLGENPLRGWRGDDGRPPFVDLHGAYDAAVADLAMAAAGELGIPARRGVYAAMPGPSYETPAEIELLRSAGATVVGMSVVPEAVAAAALGMRFAALCCVTNAVGDAPVEHGEVTEVADRFAASLRELLAAIVTKI